MKTAILLCALLLTISLGGGCGAARPSKYYQLTVPGDVAPAAGSDPYHVTLMLAPITSSHLYREDHIVYTDNAQYMGVYQYQRWAEPPTEMIRDVLLRELRASSRFEGVYPWGSNVRGDYILRGHLYDFREISAANLVGRVTLELELRDARTGATVWTHFFSHDQPVASKDVAAVVAALDQDVQQAITEFRVSLDQYFSAHPEPNTKSSQ
jgi:cholesterol transport system auxiliary component